MANQLTNLSIGVAAWTNRQDWVPEPIGNMIFND